ncbi:MAG: nitrilase family protein, partial [Bacteroidetes bacterium]
MKKYLNITLVQTDTVWKNIKKNLEILTIKLNDISDDTDLIVLPELFSTGFTMKGENIAELMDGKSVLWMKQMSKKKDCLLIGSLIINDDSNIFNRLIVAFPNGELKYYDKRHLFSFADEDKVFAQGKTRLVFDYKGFKICPLICYDLRFPVWA